MTEKLRIAIDFSQLDSISPASGQYRYATDLMRGLADLRPDVDFLLLGSGNGPVPELHSVFQKYGDRWKYCQLPRWQFRGADYFNQVRYSLLLLRERISLLHSLHSFVPLLSPCPIVNTIYDLMYELFDDYAAACRSRPYRTHKWGVKHLVRRVICISETTAADLRRHWNVADDRIDVVPLGSDFVEAEATEETKSKLPGLSDSSLLLSPFNLEPRKNLDALLEATALLNSSRHDVKLVLFGYAAVTPVRNENFERRIRELGLSQKVICTGVLTNQELATLYRQATLFVFPSLYEGFGLPLLEAMSAGACVVARDASAMAEVVGKAGVLIETTDAAGLAAAIAKLLDNESLRCDLGRQARERARLFSTERMATLTYQSYMAALNQEVSGSTIYVNGWPAS